MQQETSKITRQPVRCILALTLALVLSARSNAHASGGVRTVALNGDSVTGNPTLVYSGFNSPALNEHGQVAFSASLQGGTTGLFRSHSIGTEAVVTEGTVVPGGSGFFESFSSPLLNDAGEIAFIGAQRIGGQLQSKSIVVRAGASDHSVLAKTGEQPPEEELGVVFSEFRTLRLNDAGHVTFTADLLGSSIDDNSNLGLYAYQEGLRRVAREGALPPGGAPDGVGAFYDIPEFRSTLNESGEIAFTAAFDVPPESEYYPGGWGAVFKESGGTLEVIARQGTRPPGAIQGSRFGYFASPSINRAGEVAFDARASQGAGGLYASVTNFDLAPIGPRLNQVVDVGGMEYQFGGFIEFEASNEAHLINRHGLTAFASFLVADTELGRQGFHGVFTATSNGMSLTALTGHAAPGFASGTTLHDFFNGGNGFAMAINGQDQVAFTATVEDTQGNESRALFATDQQGDLQLIVGVGQLLDVGDNHSAPDLREVFSFTFIDSSGDGDGRRSAFNDRGQIAFSAQFTDGSSGVFISDTVAILAGDYNNDGVVDAADYSVWRDNLGGPEGTLVNDIDGGDIGPAQYATWRANYGASRTSPSQAFAHQTPEPTTVFLAALALSLGGMRRRVLRS